MYHSILQSQFNQVKTFMSTFKQQMPRGFVDANNNVAQQRKYMLEEEYNEWSHAEPLSDDLLDALVDILYIAHGNLLALGLKLELPATSAVYTLTIKKLSLHQTAAKALFSLSQRPLCQDRLRPDHAALIESAYLAGVSNGFDVESAFNDVHSANMKKLWSAEELPHSPYKNKVATEGGYIVYNDSGKVVKPPSWQPANLHKYVTKALQTLQPAAESPAPLPASPASTGPAEHPSPAAPSSRRAPVKLTNTGKS